MCILTSCGNAIIGKLFWEKEKVVDTKNGACIQLTQNGDNTRLFTDQGDLIRTQLTPKGFEGWAAFTY